MLCPQVVLLCGMFQSCDMLCRALMLCYAVSYARTYPLLPLHLLGKRNVTHPGSSQAARASKNGDSVGVEEGCGGGVWGLLAGLRSR